jgi:hypothetical protein
MCVCVSCVCVMCVCHVYCVCHVCHVQHGVLGSDSYHVQCLATVTPLLWLISESFGQPGLRKKDIKD